MNKYILTIAALLFGFTGGNAAQLPAPASDDAVTITLEFSDGEKEVWPFKTPARKAVGTSSDKSRNSYGQEFLNEMFDCVTKDGYTFKLFVTGMLVEHKTFGLRYAGIGDGFDFPVIPGKSLTVISVTNGFKGPSNIGAPRIVTTDNEEVEGGSAISKKLDSGESWSWIIKGQPGKSYRMAQTTKQEMDLRKLELIYTGNPNKPIAVNVASGKVGYPTPESVSLNAGFKAINGDVSKFKAGFEYKKAGDEFWENKASKVDDGFNFSASFKSLAKDTKYEYRPWAQAKGSSKVYGAVKTFFTGDITLSIDFTKDAKGKTNAIYTLPSSRLAANSFSEKIQNSSFGTEYQFRMWGVSGVAKSTNGGAVTGLALNPMLAQATQNGAPFGKKGNAWIELPGLDGRAIKSIKLAFLTSRGTMNVSGAINKKSGEGSKDLVPDFTLTNKVKTKTLDIKDAEKGKPCYICVEDAANVIISQMTIVYAL